MAHFFILEDGTDTRIEGTPEQLEAELRRVGLISDSDNDYKSLKEFLDSNRIQLYKNEVKMEVLSVEELVERWD